MAANRGVFVSERLQTRLDALSRLSAPSISGGRIGIEKEGLRVTPGGHIAGTSHPRGLGSALTNRYITTDYSEALVELVTPPAHSPWEAIRFLCDLHEFIYEELTDEMLWPLSMPCLIRSEQDIPLARYGASNIGRMKTIYRRGLGHRYGRYMQAIAGIHFNYSLPESFWPVLQAADKSVVNPTKFRSDAYFGLVRNVRRLDWLLLLLFGASPAVCKSFLRGETAGLEDLDDYTLYGRYATSLRMSDIGYQNTHQAEMNISANSLDEYVANLIKATHTISPEFEKLGLKDGDTYLQLSTNKLQIENEYYSTIRPKRVARSGEKPTSALSRGGVEYVELRALDISPFDPVGINQQQVRFLEVFLLYCLLIESPPLDEAEQNDIFDNHGLVARRGRQPDLQLRRAGSPVSLQEWGSEICEQMSSICEALDPKNTDGYLEIIQAQGRALENTDLTPSAKLLVELEESGQSLFQFGLQQSGAFRDYFLEQPSDLNRHRDLFRQESLESLSRQAIIESEDVVSFKKFLSDYNG